MSLFIFLKTPTGRLGLSALSLISFASCKIGNYVQNSAGPSSLAGFYETIPSGPITMCATLPQGNGTQTKCLVLPASHLDGLISGTLTDPVDLQYDATTGLFFLAPSNDPTANTKLPAIGDLQGDLSFPINAGSLFGFTPMLDSHNLCNVEVSLGIQGGKATSGGIFSSGSTLPILGRIAMDLTWDYTPTGTDCSFISACYSDGTQCSSADQSMVKFFYEPFVDAGILAATDLSQVLKLEYQVSYR